jgi:hypothetical protein
VSGSNASVTKASVEAVLTGPIGTHTHSSISGLNVAAGSEGDLVTGTMADNDLFRIRIGGASNVGWIEIATADDSAEAIYVRQYSGVFATLTRTLTLLDASGNTTIPGNISGTGNADFSKFLGLLADTVSAPSFTWTGDLTTGIYHPTTSQIAISIAGTQRGLWSSSGLIVTGAVSANTGFSTSTSTGYSINGGRFVYYDGTTYLGNIDGIGTGPTIIRSGGINALSFTTGAATFVSSVSATSFSGAGTGLTGTAPSLTAGLLTHSSGRTDGTVYPVIWGVANAGTQAYSCTAVNIQSSTGTLNANITRVKELIITDTGGVDKYRISYNASTDSLETTKL